LCRYKQKNVKIQVISIEEIFPASPQPTEKENYDSNNLEEKASKKYKARKYKNKIILVSDSEEFDEEDDVKDPKKIKFGYKVCVKHSEESITGNNDHCVGLRL